jgi:hypothetical protein
VTVPARATPGTYTVTLSAAVSGQRRAADATFTVVASDAVVRPDAPVAPDTTPATLPALPVLTQALGALKRPSLATLPRCVTPTCAPRRNAASPSCARRRLTACDADRRRSIGAASVVGEWPGVPGAFEAS